MQPHTSKVTLTETPNFLHRWRMHRKQRSVGSTEGGVLTHQLSCTLDDLNNVYQAELFPIQKTLELISQQLMTNTIPIYIHRLSSLKAIYIFITSNLEIHKTKIQLKSFSMKLTLHM